jgi:hypothetical protein
VPDRQGEIEEVTAELTNSLSSCLRRYIKRHKERKCKMCQNMSVGMSRYL